MMPKGITTLILSLLFWSVNMSAQALVISCPEDEILDVAGFTNIPEGTSVDQLVEAWFSDWLVNFRYTDNGCNPIETGLDDVNVPSAAFGGSVTVNYNVTDECGNQESCSASFEVIGSIMEPIVVSCPPPVVMPAGSNQSQIDSAFSIWINAFTAIPFNALTTDLSGIISPRPGDPVVDVTFLAEDPNNADNTGSCVSSFTPPTATIIDMNDEIPTLGQWGILSLFICLLIVGVKTITASLAEEMII